jgi:hypothetical protein
MEVFIASMVVFLAIALPYAMTLRKFFREKALRSKG